MDSRAPLPGIATIAGLALDLPGYAQDKIIVRTKALITTTELDGSTPVDIWSTVGPASDLAVDSQGQVYWTEPSTNPAQSNLMRGSSDGTGTPTLLLTSPPNTKITFFEIDPAGSGTAYWCDALKLEVYRSDLSGGGTVSLSTSAQTIRDLAIDLRSTPGHLYVYNGSYLWRSDLPDGTNEVMVEGQVGEGSSGAIALDPCTDSIFILGFATAKLGPNDPFIRRGQLSFTGTPEVSDLTTILSGTTDVGHYTGTTHELFIAIDGVADHMYWTSRHDALNGQVRSANLDGSGVTLLFTNSVATQPYTGIALLLADGDCDTCPLCDECGAAIWDNGRTDGSAAYSNAVVDVFGFRRTLLDDFTLSITSTPSQITWTNLWASGQTPPFGTSAEFALRVDAGGAPGVVAAQLSVTAYTECATGNVYFNLPEACSTATLDAPTITAGTHWIEGTIVGADNNFWLLKSTVTGSECWVNYDDFGGLLPGSGVSGEPPRDLNFCLR